MAANTAYDFAQLEGSLDFISGFGLTVNWQLQGVPSACGPGLG